MKYEMIPEDGLYRIRALKDFGNVKCGDWGGLVEYPDNLSHYGTCWVGRNARVLEYAWVGENACVTGHATMSENARALSNAFISGHALVRGNARIAESCTIRDSAFVQGECYIGGRARIEGNAFIHGRAKVSGGLVTGHADIGDDCIVTRDITTLYLSPHKITITDNNMRIGCRTLSRYQWLAMSDKAIAEFPGGAEFNKKFGLIIRQLLNEV